MNIPYKYFDIVLGGGGFRSYYHMGVFKIINQLVFNNTIKIRYYIGTSSGAISAVYAVCGVNDDNILLTYDLIKTNMSMGLDLHDATLKALNDILPLNVHLLVNNKIKIYVSELGWFGFNKKYLTYFNTRQDLFNAISASINIPFLTRRSIFGTIINGYRCYDGLFTKIVPAHSINDLEQLTVYTHKVKYPKHLTLQPNDNNISLLGVRGFIDAQDFINNYETPIIKWYCHKPKNKTNLIYILMPLLMSLKIFL